jgi:pyruvate formate lyase activating enzyme
MTGFIHSFQSLGAVDGPGIRFVVFMQGCPLRCACCHNPDTWEINAGNQFSSQQILEKVLRFREYFGKDGGITVSGGEPLLQAEFVTELFSLCHENGINTCLDTSGAILTSSVKKLLDVTDRVLLDIKYTDSEGYKRYVGCEFEKVISFLEYLNERKIPTTLRQVIIPNLNDSDENISRLKALSHEYPCVDKTELLPFRKICQMKYDKMGIEFPLADIPEPSEDKIKELYKILKSR